MNRFLSTGEFQYEREGEKIPIRFRGMNTQFVALNRTVFKYGYEIETAMTLDVLAKGDAVFYDIGSNWGYFSLYLASKSNYTVRIFAFEPVRLDLCRSDFHSRPSTRNGTHYAPPDCALGL